MSPAHRFADFPIPERSLVVSCQARPDNPLHGSQFMAAMARAVVAGGAAALRANGADDIAAIRASVDVPIIGLLKREDDGFPVSITPDLGSAEVVVTAGCHLVALDATDRSRRGQPLPELIARIRAELGRPVFADIATAGDGRRAAALGADCIGTTLSGYTAATARLRDQGPDLDLVRTLAAELAIPVIAEGRYDTPDLVRAAFAAGAFAVVVGTAITNPREIARRFAEAAHG